MGGLKAWWRSRAATRERARFDSADWDRAWGALPLMTSLPPEPSSRLAELALLFLRYKALEPAQGLALTDRMRLMIAFQASLPVLELGLDWYDDWYSVIVYPDAFIPQHEVMGDDGVVWIDPTVKAGESWDRGPVILSWADVLEDTTLDGHNVILHELAHKLDGRSGSTNGCPPLHKEMSGTAWKKAFTAAYDDLRKRVDRGEAAPIDLYAAESPAEFFAVASEAFFEIPRSLIHAYPEIYTLLRQFYRQHPRQRLADTRTSL